MSKLTQSPFTNGFTFTISPTLKPWKSRDPAEIERVCRAMYQPWERVIARSAELKIGFTIGNGEHILKWSGNLSDTFEWDRYKGHNNAQYAQFTFEPIQLELYMDNPPDFTYRDLKLIMDTLRRVAWEQYHIIARIGMNFEPGPEFCESSFRYVEHPEILNYQGGGHGVSIAFDGVLHADGYHYAAYPDGIPEGEPFGRFLGKQMRHFCETFGVEEVSLSNGLGFGTCPWTLNGRNFDGERFGLIDYAKESRQMEAFWEMFKAETPYPVSAQGTNWPVGADLATKCIPLREFYDRRYLGFPLGYTVSVFFNDSVGFAMQSLLTRSAHTDGFSVGFYLHDMWYPQDPFDDYPYDGEAFDLYIPASTTVIGTNGQPLHMMGTSVGANDEHGDFCPQTAVKYLPHLERALDHLPDAVSPLTLLYPFNEFHEAAAATDKRYLSDLYFADCYAACAIDSGLPLNTVCATENFEAALRTGALRDTILYSPMPFEQAGYVEQLIAYIQQGGQVLLVGSEERAHPLIRSLLGLASAEGIEGELRFSAHPALQDVADGPLSEGRLQHRAVDSGGPVTSVLSGEAEVLVLARVLSQQVERVYAVERADPDWNGGRVVWLRGSLPFHIEDGENIRYVSPALLSAARFPRYLLSRFGYTITERFDRKSSTAQVMLWRHRNGLYFTGYVPDNTLELGLSTPDGAPVLTGMTCILRDGAAHYHIPTTLWKECRIFVRQQEGKLRCRHIHMHKFTDCVLSVEGLSDAEVLIRVPRDKMNTAEVRVFCSSMSVTQKMQTSDLSEYHMKKDLDACTIRLEHVTGRLQVNW